MRAGRLLEIFIGSDTLEVVDSSNNQKTKSVWTVDNFGYQFPHTEIIKVHAVKGILRAYVYDATAKALSQGDYEYVNKMAECVENHVFNSDTEYINSMTTLN